MGKTLKFIAFLAILACATVSHAAIAKVGSGACNGTTSANTTLAVTYSPTGGNALMVFIVVGNAGQTVSTVADNASGGSSSYGSAIATTTNGSSIDVETWGVASVKSGATTITITPSSSAQVTACVFEWSGVSGFGNHNTNSATSGSTLAVSVTTSATNSWIVGGLGDGTSASGASAGSATELTKDSGATFNKQISVWDSGLIASSGASTPLNVNLNGGLGGSYGGFAAVELKASVAAATNKAPPMID